MAGHSQNVCASIICGRHDALCNAGRRRVAVHDIDAGRDLEPCRLHHRLVLCVYLSLRLVGQPLTVRLQMRRGERRIQTRGRCTS